MDISGLAHRLVDLPRRTAAVALTVPDQAAALMQDLTRLLRRADQLLNRADLIVIRLEHKLNEIDVLTDRTDSVIDRVDEATGAAEVTVQEARETRRRAELQVARLRQLLDLYQPVLEKLAPIGREAAAAVRPAHLRGVVSLLDELPRLVDRIEPALEGMGNLLPELEGVTDRMDDVGHVVEGLPGAKILRRRGEAREEETD